MFAEFVGRHRVMLYAAAALTVVAVVATLALVVVRPHHTATSALSSGSAAAPAYLPGSDPADSTLVGGQANQLVFAQKVATALFSYGPGPDFQGRNADVMEVALAAPLGDSAGLAADLLRYTPTGAALSQIRSSAATATFRVLKVSISQWAARKLTDIGAQAGTYGIDVVGVQIITLKGTSAVSLSVSMGLTLACAPAVDFCGLDRVQPPYWVNRPPDEPHATHGREVGGGRTDPLRRNSSDRVPGDRRQWHHHRKCCREAGP